MRPYLAISINGGGALGIGPLAFMERLESDVGRGLNEIGVAFAGTSTGSIIAGGFDEGYNAHELRKLYRENLKKIFTKYSWYKRLQPSCHVLYAQNEGCRLSWHTEYRLHQYLHSFRDGSWFHADDKGCFLPVRTVRLHA
jgi:predicted acylesterase/phospholipase RssA